jgi:hypothetical protein
MDLFKPHVLEPGAGFALGCEGVFVSHNVSALTAGAFTSADRSIRLKEFPELCEGIKFD